MPNNHRITRTFPIFVNGTFYPFEELGPKEDIESMINAIRGIYTDNPNPHDIELKSACIYWYDTDEFGTWELNFTGKNLAVSDLDPLFLRPIFDAWDMTGIDQTFDHIAITHNRGEIEDDDICNIKIQITAWS